MREPGSLAAGPVVRRVRAYFAPVDRLLSVATVWDAATIAEFAVDAPPAPWIDLGWCSGFKRRAGTKVEALATGSPAMAAVQVRTAVEAEVELAFDTWGKLQMALTAGSQQMNVLARAAGAVAGNGSGGRAAGSLAVLPGSTASELLLEPGAAGTLEAGDVVAVDVDYAGQTGYLGSGVSGGYVRDAAAIANDTDYVRRVTLNVARVMSVDGAVAKLSAPLLAGMPAAGMRASRVAGFCDREGGSFVQEWSALFAVDGALGDRVVFHYPRLQSMGGAEEAPEALLAGRHELPASGMHAGGGVGKLVAGARQAGAAGHGGVGQVGRAAAGLERMRLAGRFRALPVRDANDGEMVVCFRSYLPSRLGAVLA